MSAIYIKEAVIKVGAAPGAPIRDAVAGACALARKTAARVSLQVPGVGEVIEVTASDLPGDVVRRVRELAA